MATTTNYNLPLIQSSEYSTKLVSEFIESICGTGNTSALVMIDSLLHGKANLENGKIPSSELPSYVDDVVEGYFYNNAFYSDSLHSNSITGETGKIYVDLTTNNSYRWGGSAYIKISSDKLVFTNVSASSWVSDNTYNDYDYACTITCNGITSNSVVEVIFDVAEAISGDYAPVCTTGANSVTIYGKVNTSITIPVIKEL